MLSGGSDTPKPAAAGTSTATPAASEAPRPTPRPAAGLRRQVLTLDGLMKLSEQGRAAAVKGDTKAAIANRTKLLAGLKRLDAQATDARLKAGLRSFTAAIRESLRQNSECADRCSAGELNKVNRLKRQAVAELNPLLRRFARSSYDSRDI